MPNKEHVLKRQTARNTWLSTKSASSPSFIWRFIIGNSTATHTILEKESNEYGDMIVLSIDDQYKSLSQKTVVFFKFAVRTFSCAWYVKIDDDIYIRPAVLLQRLRYWTLKKANYVGCLFFGDVQHSNRSRYYEPLHAWFSDKYPAYIAGPFYAISYDAAEMLAVESHMRFFANEDVTIGLWMLAHNINRQHDSNLCARGCFKAAAVITARNGIPSTEIIERLHNNYKCRE